jgi:hypothetical protein
MRFWTVLLGLAVAIVLVSNVSAQDQPKKKPGAAFKEMDTNKDGKLQKQEYLDARTKNVDSVEFAKARAEKEWKTIAGDKAEVNQEEYEAGVKKLREGAKSKKRDG